jgi:hypothetical protein
LPNLFVEVFSSGVPQLDVLTDLKKILLSWAQYTLTDLRKIEHFDKLDGDLPNETY